MKLNENAKKILDYVKKNKLNSTSEIAKGTGVNRVSVGKYLYAFEMMGKIKCTRHGMKKLWWVGK